MQLITDENLSEGRYCTETATAMTRRKQDSTSLQNWLGRQFKNWLFFLIIIPDPSNSPVQTSKHFLLTTTQLCWEPSAFSISMRLHGIFSRGSLVNFEMRLWDWSFVCILPDKYLFLAVRLVCYRVTLSFPGLMNIFQATLCFFVLFDKWGPRLHWLFLA